MTASGSQNLHLAALPGLAFEVTPSSPLLSTCSSGPVSSVMDSTTVVNAVESYGGFAPTFILGFFILFSLHFLTQQVFGKASSKKPPTDPSGLPEPPLVPYLIPFFGHSFQMLRNFEATFENATKWSGSAGMYTLYAGGQKMYVATTPRYIQAIERREKTIAVDPLTEIFLTDQLGVSQKTVELLVAEPNAIKEAHPFFKDKIVQGEGLDYITDRAEEMLQESVRDLYSSRHVQMDGPNGRTLSLVHWSREAVFVALTDAIYGKTLLELHPALIKDFFTYEENYWVMFFNIPGFLAPKGAKESIKSAVKMMSQWYSLPRDQRPATPVIEELEDRLRARGVSTEACAAISMSFLFGVHSNVMKVVAWLLLHVTTDAELTTRIRAEVAPAFDANGVLIPGSRHIPNNCPILTACFNEVLRLTSGALDYRKCTEDTIVDDFILKEGGVVMAHSRNIHLSKELWGANPREFHPERFLANPKLAQGPGFRAFGGGKVLCPGRNVAKHACCTMVALMLNKFDVELPGGKAAIPDLATRIPNPSIYDITPEKRGLKVLIRKRKV